MTCRSELCSRSFIFRATKKKPQTARRSGVSYRSLTMTYSHMVKHHTTIGDASFHY
jgi:hypothetical protein